MRPAVAAAPVPVPPRRTGVLLAIACAAQFIAVLDASIVNVALPPMQESLGLSPTGLQWVVSSYALTFAGFLLLGGRVGDLFGRKRAFVVGLGLFAAASLAAGLAQEGWQVVAARFVQGLGGAVLVPTTLSLVAAGSPDARAKARALSLLTAAAASGSALGGVIGGLLTGLLSWRWVFFVNVPLGVALVLAALWALPGRPPGHVRGRLDVPGSVTVTVATAALVGAVILGEERGWTSAATLGCLSLAVASAALFVLVERRAEEPVVPLDVFGVRSVTVANGLSALVGGLLPTTMFFLALYLQRVLGMDPLQAGLALTPGAVGIALGARGASRWMAVLGPRRSYVLGALVAAGSLAWLSGIDVEGRYAVDVLVPLTLAMAGFGASGLPLTVTAMSGLPPERTGLASGLLNTSRQVGSAVGLAALVSLASAVAARHGGADDATALTSGFGTAFLVGAGLLVVASVLARALPARRPRHHED
ncbi:drug resistance transporter, EmrB/QacA subfamily [Geodermatophilus saharensis]|uniref:Drug resistance transporter, EmrB/QacA subfamily n=1 Tax=Geodermatophilus saharensis TaxID=1137994 RepID=A0A239DKD1_9ACTN|nr:MFS transporter [Geodermatophilus saharensis]SNS33075.1 drug resistance transporter, EmrB/QacA subfamily [Geodermatophilus saharensis]